MPTEKKVRVARNFDSITKGAMSLPLPERVEMWKQLKKSIESEVANLEEAAREAKEIVKGV